MSKQSSRYSRENQLPTIGKSPMRGIHKVSPLKLRMQADKCQNCNIEEQATVCLTCLKMKCVSCGLAHSKGYPNHNVTDIKQAYQNLTEKAKQLEIHIQMINKGVNHNLENKNKKDTINYNLFEEAMNKIKSLQQQVMNSIHTYFEKITNSFITMWNNFIEIWGQGKMFSDRINTIYLKLKSFLQQDSLDQASVLAWLFKDNVFQESQQIIESYERKEKNQMEELQNTDQLMPPSIILDLSFGNKIDQMLHSLIQLVDWQIQESDYQIIGSAPNIIPIIPIGSQNLFLYDRSTKEYQVGDFQDIRQQQLPYFNKSILSPSTGILYIVGGANQKGFPVRSLLSFKDGELTNLAPLPKCKNPTNGLIIDNDKIYVIGGLRVEDERVQWSKSCEIYFITENKWMGLDSMQYTKPHQSVFKINHFIYAFGLQIQDFQNIERFNIDEHNWTTITLAHHSVNPFQFGGGYQSATINQNQVLLFGGKQWQKKTLDDQQNIFIEEDIMKTIYSFDIRQNCFQSLGEKMPGVGVSFGDYAPLVSEGKVITFETPISKVKKIHRWLQVLNVVEITFSAHQVEAEVVQIMNPE